MGCFNIFLILSPVFFQKRKSCFTCLTIPIKIVSLHNHLFFFSCSPNTSSAMLRWLYFNPTSSPKRHLSLLAISPYLSTPFLPNKYVPYVQRKILCSWDCMTQPLHSTLLLLFHLFLSFNHWSVDPTNLCRCLLFL